MAVSDNKLIKGSRRFSTTIGAGGVANDSTTTVPLSAIPAVFSDGDAIEFVVDRVSTAGALTTDYEEIIVGEVSGSNVINCARGVEGTAQAHSAGSVVEIKLTADMWNRMVAWGLVEHNQDGTHSAITATSVTTSDLIVNDDGLDLEHISTPSSPSAGRSKVYPKSDGKLYVLSSAGTEVAVVTAEDGWIAAGETWTYASADDPTFTFTIAGVDLTTKYSAGMRIKLTQTTAKYFIITKVTFSTDTTITVYGGTDYDLANAAITSPYYSTQKAPQGFPLSPVKWTVELTDTSARRQSSPTTNTWYNPGSLSISIPIGSWNTTYSVSSIVFAGSGDRGIWVALSTANNSVSDVDLQTEMWINGTGFRTVVTRSKTLDLTSKTSYYMVIMTASSAVSTIGFDNDVAKMIVRATCAYL